jgi:hypothetical protein
MLDIVGKGEGCGRVKRYTDIIRDSDGIWGCRQVPFSVIFILVNLREACLSATMRKIGKHWATTHDRCVA